MPIPTAPIQSATHKAFVAGFGAGGAGVGVRTDARTGTGVGFEGALGSGAGIVAACINDCRP